MRSTRALLLPALLLLATPAFAQWTLPGNDAHEPNDTLTSAAPLPWSGGDATWTQAMVSGRLAAGDVDVFSSTYAAPHRLNWCSFSAGPVRVTVHTQNGGFLWQQAAQTDGGCHDLGIVVEGQVTFAVELANLALFPVDHTLYVSREHDDDEDGIFAGDNCPRTFNPEQYDTNGNGTGDTCSVTRGSISGLVAKTSFGFGGNQTAINVRWSHKSAQRAEQIRRVVIVVHGSSRTDGLVYSAVRDAALGRGLASNTLIAAPRFNATNYPAQSWWWGGSGPDGVSSLAVIDSLVLKATDPRFFPNVEEIVITGFSAGGQLAQRYALVGQAEHLTALPVRYVVASPSTYAYLNPGRRFPDTSWREALFYIPKSWWQQADWSAPVASCLTTFNNWPLGLTSMDKYDAYFEGLSEKDIDDAYQYREVTYVVGAADGGSNQPNDMPSFAPNRCGVQLQGGDRRDRLQTYMAHIDWRYSGDHAHDKVFVAGVEHSATQLYTSAKGRDILFP